MDFAFPFPVRTFRFPGASLGDLIRTWYKPRLSIHTESAAKPKSFSALRRWWRSTYAPRPEPYTPFISPFETIDWAMKQPAPVPEKQPLYLWAQIIAQDFNNQAYRSLDERIAAARTHYRRDELIVALHEATDASKEREGTPFFSAYGVAKVLDLPVHTICAVLARNGRTEHVETIHSSTRSATIDAIVRTPTAVTTINFLAPTASATAVTNPRSLDDYIVFYDAKSQQQTKKGLPTSLATRAALKRDYLIETKEQQITGTALLNDLYFSTFERPAEANASLFNDKYRFSLKDVSHMTGMSTYAIRKHIEAMGPDKTRSVQKKRLQQERQQYIANLSTLYGDRFDAKAVAKELGMGLSTVRKYHANALRAQPTQYVLAA
jgi:hypothetical protein